MNNSDIQNSSIINPPFNHLKIFLFLLLFTIIFILHSIWLSAIAEDSFISFRFAQNLVSGHGLVWNIGETPVEGYTNFLWVIICSLGLILKLNLLLYSQIVGILSGLGIIIYIYLFSSKILKINERLSLLLLLLISLSGPFATWAASGMETNLFTFFVSCSFYYQFLFLEKRYRKSFILSLFLIFLATLTRPEGFGIFLIQSIILIYFLHTRDLKSLKKILIKYILVFYFFPFLIYFIWRYLYFGYLLPNTYYAKTGGGYLQWIRGIKYVLYFGLHFLLPATPLFIIYLVSFIKRIKHSYIFLFINERIKNDFEVFTILTFIFTIIAFTLYIIFVGGDYMAMYRFFVPILPIIYLLLFYVLNKLWIEKFGTVRINLLIRISVLFLFAGTFIQSTPIEKYIFSKPGILHGTYRGILFERWNSNRLTTIGKFFQRYKKSNNESIATDAIGAISFYSGLKVYGLHGLVDPYIAHESIPNIGNGFAGHEKYDYKYILDKKPTYIIFDREFNDRSLVILSYSQSVDSLIRKNYDVKSVLLNDRLNKEKGIFTFLQLKSK